MSTCNLNRKVNKCISQNKNLFPKDHENLFSESVSQAEQWGPT